MPDTNDGHSMRGVPTRVFDVETLDSWITFSCLERHNVAAIPSFRGELFEEVPQEPERRIFMSIAIGNDKSWMHEGQH